MAHCGSFSSKEGQLALDVREVEGFGVLMAQRKPGPFRIEIRSLSAVDTAQLPGKRWTGVDDKV